MSGIAMAPTTNPLDTTTHVAPGRGARSAESHPPLPATLAGAVTALVANFCAGVSGSDEMPGCIAPSASLGFGTEEAGSRDIREGLRLLDKGSDEGKNPREREKSFLPFSVSPTF